MHSKFVILVIIFSNSCLCMLKEPYKYPSSFDRPCQHNKDCIFSIQGNPQQINFECRDNRCYCEEDPENKGLRWGQYDPVASFRYEGCAAGTGYPCGSNNSINVICHSDTSICVNNACYALPHERRCKSSSDCIFAQPGVEKVIQFECQNNRCACALIQEIEKKMDKDFLGVMPITPDVKAKKCRIIDVSLPCGSQNGINVACKGSSECVNGSCKRVTFERECTKNEDCIFKPPGLFDVIHFDCVNKRCVCSKRAFQDKIFEGRDLDNLHDSVTIENNMNIIDNDMENCLFPEGSPCGIHRGINATCEESSRCVDNRCRSLYFTEWEIKETCYSDAGCVTVGPKAKCYVLKELVVDRMHALVSRRAFCSKTLPTVTKVAEKNCTFFKHPLLRVTKGGPQHKENEDNARHCYHKIEMIRGAGAKGPGQVCNEPADCPQPLQCYQVQDGEKPLIAFCDQKPPVPKPHAEIKILDDPL